MKNDIMKKSIILGVISGLIAGGILGISVGAITTSQNGVLNGLIGGGFAGILIGVTTGWLTARAGGTHGGVSVGAYTGMATGALIGGVLGAFIPDSVRIAANTSHTPIMDILTASKFETTFLICFLGAIAGTAVGALVGGRNLIPRNLREKK
jgi:MFS family permease